MTSPNRILIITSGGPSDAGWLVEQLSPSDETGFAVGEVLQFEGAVDEENLDRFDAIIVDGSMGPEEAQNVLYELMMGRTIRPVVMCVEADRQDDFPLALRQGAQDFILRGKDSREVVHRVMLNALDRAEILRATQEAEERVRAIIENISDGILIVDEADTILFANPACEVLLNKPLIELLGAPLELEIPKGSDATVEISHTSNFGIVASLRWVPIRWEGRDVRLYTIRDISSEHKTREQLRRTKEEAERLAALKTSFLANMSHELRMPLASIIGFAQLIEEGLDVKETFEFSKSIVESGNKLLETINAVLDLTRMDAQAYEVRRSRVVLRDAVQEVVDSMKPLLDDKGIPVRVSLAGNDEIQADPLAVRRIFNNLIGNALKFTKEGEITIALAGLDDSVRCDITDTGIGIDPEFIPHVFDEFAQESTGRGRTHGGSGLGLAISRRLIEAHGGRIQVSSVKGSGSTFTLRFPRNPEEAHAP